MAYSVKASTAPPAIWTNATNAATAHEEIDFTSDASQALTIPAGATGFAVSYVTGSGRVFLSPVETDDVGIRITTTDSVNFFGLDPDDHPTIYARLAGGVAATFVNIVYFFG